MGKVSIALRGWRFDEDDVFTDDGDLRTTLADNADRHHYTTFVGVGVDFNTEVVDAITAVEGANYYPVHSAKQFRRRLAEEFRYMVTPLVFDLSVTLDAADHGIATVYGTTAAEDATAEVMAANTLFPSPEREGRAKGGVILVQLAGEGSGDVALEATWETRDGRRHSKTATVSVPDREQFGDVAVRKAVLLSRYADLLKNWMVYERDRSAVAADGGVSVPPESDELGRWERQSDDLVVSERYRERIGTFADHFEAEMRAIGDDALQRDLDVLRKLESYDG
jgi:Ca-activated chloride channel family protein